MRKIFLANDSAIVLLLRDFLGNIPQLQRKRKRKERMIAYVEFLNESILKKLIDNGRNYKFSSLY